MSIKIVAELLCGACRLLGSDFDRSKMTVNPDNTLLAQSGVYVVVEFYPWFKFCFPLFQTHYLTLSYSKTKKINFKPRKKLNHNKYIHHVVA